MEEKQDQEVQETPTKVEISAEELEDLKKRAEVSSQNFERLKKAEEEKKALEAQLQEKTDADDDFFSSKEDESLRKEIARLNQKIDAATGSIEMDRLYTQYPTLKENADKFQSFSEDPVNAGMPIHTRVKAFLVENDLLEKPTQRKGLEKPTGGKNEKKSSGKLTAEDAKRLRETNPRKYLAMIEAGTLIIESE